MQTENETRITEINGLAVRIQPPQIEERAGVLIMLHGWTGDENVMWIFARRLPKDNWILAPRAPYPSNQGGYSWLPTNTGLDAKITEYQSAAEMVLALLDAWQPPHPPDRTTFSVMGFSQGAALSYSIALLHPKRIQRLAGLAGFIPQDAEGLISRRPLQGKRVFVAHGIKDDRVPVERARQAVQLLERAGASVDYCESNVGHKLGADCMRGVETFFK